jgi:hypothetical protein
MQKWLRIAPALAVLIAVCVTPVSSGASDAPIEAETTVGSAREDASWGAIKAMYRGASNAYGPSADQRGAAREGAHYPLRDSPENALEKLRQAYELMDAEAYLDCLAEDFIFYVNPDDWTNNPQLPPEWYKMDERCMHENMFSEGSTVEHVTLSFTQIGNWVEIPNSGSRSNWEYSGNYDLRLDLFGGLAYVAQEGMTLLFRVDVDQVGPGGEELWEVVNWWDVDRFESSPVEPSTWGTIKAMFL